MCKKIVNEPQETENAHKVPTTEEDGKESGSEDGEKRFSQIPGLSQIIRNKSTVRKKNADLDNEFLFEDPDDGDYNFKYEKSTASCRFEEITGFIFGGMTSRFWMLRKYINLLDERKARLIAPFFSWECLTIQFKDRELNLVIKNEHHMQNILKLLISKLKTVDGTRNTALGIINALY